jgi:L-2-hydroxyglutarate oxidase LhgO
MIIHMNEETTEIDIVIIGAGIVGLSIAKVLKESFPQKMLGILEAENYLGEHASGRNSSVLHGGIYYPTHSLKHKLCLRGNKLWESWAMELSVRLKRCGKYIVATGIEEVPNLDKIFQQAVKNEVPGIRYASEEELCQLQETTYATKAIFSPTTGILDVSDAIIKLADYLYKKEVPLLKKTKVTSLKREGDFYILDYEGNCEGPIKTSILINASGNNSVTLREQLGLHNLENYFVKGNYLTDGSINTESPLIYPIAPKNGHGLGVHNSFDTDGRVRFGPNIEKVEDVNYTENKKLTSQLKEETLRTFKNVEEDKLYWEFAGVRSKVIERGETQPYNDFWIKKVKEGNKVFIDLAGIDSPGVTAAPAIAHYVSDLLTE